MYGTVVWILRVNFTILNTQSYANVFFSIIVSSKQEALNITHRQINNVGVILIIVFTGFKEKILQNKNFIQLTITKNSPANQQCGSDTYYSFHWL